MTNNTQTVHIPSQDMWRWVWLRHAGMDPAPHSSGSDPLWTILRAKYLDVLLSCLSSITTEQRRATEHPSDPGPLD